MELLTPFDLVDMFPDKQRVAVIGNAPTLRGSGMGAHIDDHDVIVRFNDCRVRGFERDVGGRTDILVCNPYAETRPERRVADEPLPRAVVVLTPQTRRGERGAFEAWAGASRVLFSYTPDIRVNTVERENVSLTTGTYGLSLVHNILRPKDILISGFTMFLGEDNNHYWSDEQPSGLKSHAPEREARVFTDVLNSFRCHLKVTKDVAGIAVQCGRPLKEGVRVMDVPV